MAMQELSGVRKNKLVAVPAVSVYPIIRPKGPGRARDAIELRRRVLFRVRFLPKEPGVETYELDILNALFRQPPPDLVVFDQFGWNFELMAEGWEGISPDYLQRCALFAWTKIRGMTLR